MRNAREGQGEQERGRDILYICCIYFCGTAVPRSRDDKSDGEGLEITRALVERRERDDLASGLRNVREGKGPGCGVCGERDSLDVATPRKVYAIVTNRRDVLTRVIGAG